MREEIIHEVEKTERNHLVIGKLMTTTYALRRQEIVGALVAPRVRDVVDRWPALLMESQVFAEFHRINNVNLRNQFYKELDRHTPKLITLFRDKATKTGKIAEELARLMMIYDLQEQRNVNIRRALVLRALPVYLREDAFKFFRTCNSADCPDLTDTPVALLTVVTDDTINAALFSPESICIVVEDEILCSLSTLKKSPVVNRFLTHSNLRYTQALLENFNNCCGRIKRMNETCVNITLCDPGLLQIQENNTTFCVSCDSTDQGNSTLLNNTKTNHILVPLITVIGGPGVAASVLLGSLLISLGLILSVASFFYLKRSSRLQGFYRRNKAFIFQPSETAAMIPEATSSVRKPRYVRRERPSATSASSSATVATGAVTKVYDV